MSLPTNLMAVNWISSPRGYTLQVIYSKTAGETFTDSANTAVLHHYTTPWFYEEVG